MYNREEDAIKDKPWTEKSDFDNLRYGEDRVIMSDN